MKSADTLIFAITVYKLASLAVGSLSIFLGYKLFVKGIDSKAGDLKASTSKFNITLKNGAPGTFFALFGAIIISVTLYKGLAMDSRMPLPKAAKAGSSQSTPQSEQAKKSEQTEDSKSSGESEAWEESVAVEEDQPVFMEVTVSGSMQIEERPDSTSADSAEVILD